jgi:Icc protein
MKMKDENTRDPDADGIDRRGFLKCMAWAGTGVLWTVAGGVLSSRTFAEAAAAAPGAGQGTLHFAQISDSHIGFNKPANPDVSGTLRSAIAKINALPDAPSFLIHTGDITQLAQADEFDTSDQLLKAVHTDHIFYVPGEHDVTGDDGKLYRQRYGKETNGDGWYSFNQKGVHFVGLVNVMDLKAGGLGNLGKEQLTWLEKDLKSQRSSTPIVVFAHIPLWMVYPQWGWGTADGEQALSFLKRFGSVTVLNGHIHQTMQKVEGNVTFHTALSTAFPQPRPGTAPAPGPMAVPAGQLADVLGITQVKYLPKHNHLAIVNDTLSGASPEPAMAAGEALARASVPAATKAAAAPRGLVSIANFAFTPKTIELSKGDRVTWRNDDDVPHRIQSTTVAFAPSPVLDTRASYDVVLKDPGEYDYFCSLHPMMTGKIVVR